MIYKKNRKRSYPSRAEKRKQFTPHRKMVEKLPKLLSFFPAQERKNL